MEHTASKISCLTSDMPHFQTMARGHNSEISHLKWRREPRRHANRRTFTFKGSQPKRAGSRSASKQRGAGHTPTSSRNASAMRTAASSATTATAAASTHSPRAKEARLTGRSRTPATVRLRSRSNMRKQTASHRAPSRVASRGNSEAGSQPASRRTSSVIGTVAGRVDAGVLGEAASTAAEPHLLLPPPPPPLLPRDTTDPRLLVGLHTISPRADVKTDQSKLVSSPAKHLELKNKEDTDDEEDDDDDVTQLEEPNVIIELPQSPPVVEYRKVMYSEAEHKWIQHLKVVENLKHARMRKKREARLARLARLATKIQPPARKRVKGRSTARMQHMFPTAIIKHDDRPGATHNINMTDALRVELHKRKVPIVPTHYQHHILQFGKLPFRNNPRPHPVI